MNCKQTKSTTSPEVLHVHSVNALTGGWQDMNRAGQGSTQTDSVFDDSRRTDVLIDAKFA
jgi:hypothetical protein